MRGQVRTLNEMVVNPWMQLLAVLVGLTILFLICTARASAGLTPMAVHNASDSLAKHPDCFPKGTTHFYEVKSWYLDFNDISNETFYEPAKDTSNKKSVIIKKTGKKVVEASKK